MALSSKKYVRTSRLQIILGLICIVLILASIYFPWWKIRVVSGRHEWLVTVFPHGLYGDILPYGFGMPYAGSPIFMIFTGVFAVCVFLCLLGSVLKGKKGKALLLTAGVILLIILFVFNYRLEQACVAPFTSAEEGSIVSGSILEGVWQAGDYEYVWYTGFQLGFYLAAIAGLACIISPFLVYIYERLHR